MIKSKLGFDELIMQGRIEKGRETAQEMFADGESIVKIKRYSDLPDKDLADVLRGLPQEIQIKYNLADN